MAGSVNSVPELLEKGQKQAVLRAHVGPGKTHREQASPWLSRGDQEHLQESKASYTLLPFLLRSSEECHGNRIAGCRACGQVSAETLEGRVGTWAVWIHRWEGRVLFQVSLQEGVARAAQHLVLFPHLQQ